MATPALRCLQLRKLFWDLLKKNESVQSPSVRLFGDNANKIIKRVVYTANVPKETERVFDISRKSQRILDLQKRPLGGLEKYYYNWGNIWDDAFGTLISFTSKQPINIVQLATAISAIIQRHAVLNLAFQTTDETVKLVTQMENIENLEIVGKAEFDLIFQTFSLENKMWRLVIMNPEAEETTRLSLGFIVHHSFCDFTYNRAMIRDLLSSLIILQQGSPIDFQSKVPLSEPIENLIQYTNRKGTDTDIKFPTKDCNEKDIAHVTDLCKRHFQNAYHEIYREDTSKILRWSIGKNLTQGFQSSLSKCHGSMNSALLAVFFSSFMELVKSSIKDTEVVELLFSVMVNLRKYLGNAHVYNGNASIDTLGSITLDSNLKYKNDFWSIAFEISKKMREIVSSGEPLRYLYEDVPETDFHAVIDSNKREVIALTHTGPVDDYLGLGGHFNLVDYKVNMRTSRDVGPIFNVETHLLEEELVISLGYNSGLIPDTAAHDMSIIASRIIETMSQT